MKRDEVIDVPLWGDLPDMADQLVRLRLVERRAADLRGGHSPSYRFAITQVADGVEIGGITLRVGRTRHEELYRGNIGFTVFEAFRGRRVAGRACALVAPLARRHGLRALWLTCDEENVASRRTIERLGAQFVGLYALPSTDPYAPDYPSSAPVKRRYRWTL